MIFGLQITRFVEERQEAMGNMVGVLLRDQLVAVVCQRRRGVGRWVRPRGGLHSPGFGVGVTSPSEGQKARGLRLS
eukprot:9081912-Pyramimonas_sp.AAC.1